MNIPRKNGFEEGREAEIAYSIGYDRGYTEGFQQAVYQMAEAVGLSLTEHGGDSGAAESEEERATTETSTSIPPPPPPPQKIAPQNEPAPTHPSVARSEEPPQSLFDNCTRCQHSRNHHEPLSAKACFADKCKCSGYTQKKGLKIGPLRIMK